MDNEDTAGLLQVTFDANMMDRNATLVTQSDTASNLFTIHTISNPYVANYLDVLDKREKELQDRLDQICLKAADKERVLEYHEVTLQNKKALLRASLTAKIERELEQEIERLEKENQELSELLA